MTAQGRDALICIFRFFWHPVIRQPRPPGVRNAPVPSGPAPPPSRPLMPGRSPRPVAPHAILRSAGRQRIVSAVAAAGEGDRSPCPRQWNPLPFLVSVIESLRRPTCRNTRRCITAEVSHHKITKWWRASPALRVFIYTWGKRSFFPQTPIYLFSVPGEKRQRTLLLVAKTKGIAVIEAKSPAAVSAESFDCNHRVSPLTPFSDGHLA